MAEEAKVDQEGARPLGLRDALLVYAAPRKVFSRVEDTGAYGWALVVLIVLITLIGYTEVQTGLTDRVVDRGTEQELAELERTRVNLTDRAELREAMEEVRKKGEFMKLITRLGAVVALPVYMLASILLIASCLYAAVALTGRKPEYHTLVSICVYASFVELLGHAVRLAMLFAYETTEVDTSLRVLATSKSMLWLGAIDPFRIWFWLLVVMGLAVTHQLSRRMAVVSCTLLFAVATGVRVAKEYLPV